MNWFHDLLDLHKYKTIEQYDVEFNTSKGAQHGVLVIQSCNGCRKTKAIVKTLNDTQEIDIDVANSIIRNYKNKFKESQQKRQP